MGLWKPKSKWEEPYEAEPNTVKIEEDAKLFEPPPFEPQQLAHEDKKISDKIETPRAKRKKYVENIETYTSSSSTRRGFATTLPLKLIIGFSILLYFGPGIFEDLGLGVLVTHKVKIIIGLFIVYVMNKVFRERFL